MKGGYGWLVLVALCAISRPSVAQQITVAGTWEGQSTCTIRESPCHDEHVVYEIKSDPSAQNHFSVDAYKIVNGEKDFMGTLQCRYPTGGMLVCIGRHPDDVWSFLVTDTAMTGTLTVGPDKKLFRKVQVTRKK